VLSNNDIISSFPILSMKLEGKHMCPVCMLAAILVLIGALNWGLVGLGWFFGGADWNVVHLLLGKWATLEAVVYVLVGLAAVYKLFAYPMCCGKCCEKCANPMKKM
jgi:uncharacterized membrane protein YuzA (DUF378 family)